MNFEFATASRIVFGLGTTRQAGTLARTLGRSALLVTGTTTQRHKLLLESLKSANVEVAYYSFPGEPSVSTIVEGVAVARKAGCDCVIGCGGGSPIDAAKAIAAMLTNPGDLLDYLEVIGRGKPLVAAPAPCMAIPTTAGTGSEVTRNAVLSAPEHKVKVSLRSPLMLPKIALVDPELTFSLPRSITASTGLDAVTQLIEPYVCSRANAMVDLLCVEGLTRAANSLRIVYQEPDNVAARENMALASLFGGMALANAGLGAVHGFAGPIGGMFPAPHGGICAALLPHVIEGNLQALRMRAPESKSLQRYEKLARLTRGQSEATADALVTWASKLVADLGIAGLSHYGMTAGDATLVSEKASQASSMKANPITLTAGELEAIFKKAL